jgi:dynein assembly factor 3
MTDWDYNFGIKDFSKTVNSREYKAWRLTGIAFETRLNSGTIANRTMGSYVAAKTVS